MKIDRIIREQRGDADRAFNRMMSNMDGYGREADEARKKGNLAKAKGIEEKIREAQNEAKRIIEYKLQGNRKMGRTLNDGQVI